MARSLLAAAPLFMAQVGAQEIRKELSTGDDEVFDRMGLATRGTAGEFVKAIGKMSPLGILRLTDKKRWEAISEKLLQHGDDLDYVQTLLNVLGDRTDINPAMNAVVDAFNRRRFTGRFKMANQSVELDTLLNESTKGVKDGDEAIQQKTKRQEATQRSTSRPCFLFQTSNCTFRTCKYRHACMICQSPGHGSATCPTANAQRSTPVGSAAASVVNPPPQQRPPHNRFRRDRAHGNQPG